MKSTSFVLMIAVVMVSAMVHETTAEEIQVTITSNAPTGGVHFTPVWVGFHNGSFDIYDEGQASAPQLEDMAEDGNAGPLSSVFAANGTLVPSNPPVGTRVQGTIGSAPVAPGQSVSATFDLATNTDHRYFSYVSMVLPSNDYYIANDDVDAVDLSSLHQAAIGTTVTLNVGLPETVNDAGTEVNFEKITFAGDTEDDTVAGLGLLGAQYKGQTVAQTGTSEGGVNTVVAGAYAQAPSILSSHPNLDFNNGSLYPDGIATIIISVVPEPASALLLGLGVFALVKRRRPVMK